MFCPPCAACVKEDGDQLCRLRIVMRHKALSLSNGCCSRNVAWCAVSTRMLQLRIVSLTPPHLHCPHTSWWSGVLVGGPLDAVGQGPLICRSYRVQHWVQTRRGVRTTIAAAPRRQSASFNRFSGAARPTRRSRHATRGGPASVAAMPPLGLLLTGGRGGGEIKRTACTTRRGGGRLECIKKQAALFCNSSRAPQHPTRRAFPRHRPGPERGPRALRPKVKPRRVARCRLHGFSFESVPKMCFR